MSKSKFSKKALVSSALSLVLCFSTLIGATFAWFTADSSTDMNQIQSGTLKVDMVDASGATLVGTKLDFADANGATDILWEPGCTFNLEDIYIKNDGDLALKYKIVINEDAVTGDKKLLDVIDWTVSAEGAEVDIDTYIGHLAAGETSALPVVITGHMDEEAGNEYQGLSIEKVSVIVYATQDTVEYDSFDNQYDAGATLPATAASSADSLFRAAAAGKDVNLVDDIDVVEDIVMSDTTVIDGEGFALYKDATNDEGDNAGVLTPGGTIKNISISGSGDNTDGKGFRAVYAKNMTDDLALNNVTLEGTYALNASGTGILTVKDSVLSGWTSFDVDSAEFVNVEFTAQGTSTDGFELNTFRTYNDTVLTDCSFISPYIFSAGQAGITIELNHCVFAGEAITATNFAELFEIAAGDALYNCTIIVDGAQVSFN